MYRLQYNALRILKAIRAGVGLGLGPGLGLYILFQSYHKHYIPTPKKKIVS